jgi:hypothetical protein
LDDIDKMPSDALNSHLAASESAIFNAERELEANPKYQELKASLKAVSEGFREVKKRQRAIITYILGRLDDLA